MLYNIWNFPDGVVPVSTVTEAGEEEPKLYRGCCDDPWDQTLKQVCNMESGGAETADGCSSDSFTEIKGSSMSPSMWARWKKISPFFIHPLQIPFLPGPKNVSR